MNQATKPSPLGRGLSALFGDADASYQPKPIATTARGDKAATKIAIEFLQPGAFQPRRHFDEDTIKGLAESIRERGILQPLLVRALPGAKDAYEIVAGERRWRAAQLAGLHEVPVVVRDISDREALEIGLIENVQRQDLSPLEEAEGYKRLLEEFQHTHEDLAKTVGKSRSHISNLIRLLSLPKEVKQMIERGELSAGHARTLIVAKNPLQLAAEIISKGLSVRQAEALAKSQSSAADNKNAKPSKSTAQSDADILALEKGLQKLIGLKVKIQTDGKAGSITFYYQDLDQLDGIIKKLNG